MRVLVTGGSGYIGSRVLRDLAARQEVEEIVDLDLRPPPAPIGKVQFVQRSVTGDLRDVFRERAFDVALHLAWTVDPLRDAAQQREICIGGTTNFLAGCEAGAVRQVFFMSSATAYGAHPAHAVPLDESAPLRPRYHFQYSAEKREAEGLVDAFASAHPEVVVQKARPVVVCGPHIGNFIIRSMEKSPTLRPLRDGPVQVVHEDDCAAAVAAIVASRRPGAFNVVADGTLTLTEAMRRLGTKALPVPVPVMYAAAWAAWNLGLTRVAEAPPGFVWFVAWPWLVSNRRLKEELGFRFRYDCSQALDAYLAARQKR